MTTMMKYGILCLSILLFTAAPVAERTAEAAEAHWGYIGEFAPDAWDKADPSFMICKTGKNQAPIDILPQYKTELPELHVEYPIRGNSAVNNGHTVQVQFPRGNFLKVGGDSFALVQAHFHSPAENRYQGKTYPMEAHFVHQDREGNLAVLAVLFEEGNSNPGLAFLWENMPRKTGEVKNLPGGFDPASLIPSSKEYAYFNGSLTTPPCSEGVRWYVLKDAVSAEKEQIETFSSVMGHPNNRPLQSLNARPVLY
jgi:carbonic anhydrase